MARRKVEVQPSVYRFMCVRDKNTNYHLDFASLNEATAYIEELNDPKIEWYGLYEISPIEDHLKTVVYKRVKPFIEPAVISKTSPAVKSRKNKSSK